MPVTRSATRLSSRAGGGGPLVGRTGAGGTSEGGKARRVRGSSSKVEKAPTRAKNLKASGRQKTDADSVEGEPGADDAPVVRTVDGDAELSSAPAFLPAVLSFSFEEAKRHLVGADPRFEDLFARLKCRPFEHLERVDPFRTLATSILGQQISWLAARSITHRFIRLFDPSLPEKPPASGSSNADNFFPSARQVVGQDVATLRTAGLSGRKAEYVQDLAARFADGRLSNEKILNASDEELYEMLTAVRGIGKWTGQLFRLHPGKRFCVIEHGRVVDMFAIFSLRRPDIMPVGDLGVQRGMVRWFLSLHSPKHAISISPRKLAEKSTAAKDSEIDGRVRGVVGEEETGATRPGETTPERALTPDAAPFPPAPIPTTPVTPVKRKRKGVISNGDENGIEEAEVPLPPPAFTPSINRTLNRVLPTKYHLPALPDGLSVRELQSRVEGKKKIKGAILTPKEMEELTESWRPYRSLGVFYMWALAEGDKS